MIVRNTIANYIGQGYSILIGIVVTPLYLQYLGVEEYGLIGFFALMQAWLYLLDLGLTPTLSRQIAYAQGKKGDFEFFKKLLRSFELIFIAIAIAIVLSIYFSSGWIAKDWIRAETINRETLIYCISLMGCMSAMRWVSGLYRSGISGLEDQVWLNTATIIFSTLKFIGALAVLAYFTRDVRYFFLYQLIIGLIELLTYFARLYQQLPSTKHSPKLFQFDWPAVKSVAPFTLGVAYTAGIWILITQTDKLILSSVLDLAEFSYFSLIVLVTGGITALSGPISQAVMPRLTLYVSQGKHNELISLYRESSQIVFVVSLSLSLIIGLYSKPLIYSWTGNVGAAEWVNGILIWFALGNGLLAIGGFQYYLQNSFGNLKLHVLGSTISAIIQIPIIYLSAINYGALGAGLAWFLYRLTWFLCWTPIVHRVLLPGFHIKWMVKDIFPIAITTIITAIALNRIVPLEDHTNRLITFVEIILLGCILLVISSISARAIRNRLLNFVREI